MVSEHQVVRSEPQAKRWPLVPSQAKQSRHRAPWAQRRAFGNMGLRVQAAAP